MNTSDHPNTLHCNGDSTYSRQFGKFLSANAVSLDGRGHHPHVDLHFQWGVLFKLTPADATELARSLPEVLAKLGILPNCSGILADLEEQP